ncbi:hypothetical protein BI330_24595 [Mycobacterium sp. CBMA 623]|nr:hypothetical protein [Mycobacteroides sp. CBMA 326]
MVLGGSGQTGRGVADMLETSGYTVRRASRRSEWAFDWDDETTWSPVLTGARRIYVVLPERRFDWARFLVALSSSGIERAAVLTARNPGVSGDGIADGAEEAFTGSSIDSAFIRPSWFSQNFIAGLFSRQLDATGELRLPVGDGKEPFIDYRDISAVAAQALLANDSGTQSIEVSGPELLGFDEAVSIVGEVTGRELVYVPISLDEWRREALHTKVPEPFVDTLANLFRAIAEHRDEYLSSGVMGYTGRPARSFRQTIADTLAPETS